MNPDFRSAEFLQAHLLHTLAFYDGRCLDASGGFFHFYKADAQVHDRPPRSASRAPPPHARP